MLAPHLYALERMLSIMRTPKFMLHFWVSMYQLSIVLVMEGEVWIYL